MENQQPWSLLTFQIVGSSLNSVREKLWGRNLEALAMGHPLALCLGTSTLCVLKLCAPVGSF